MKRNAHAYEIPPTQQQMYSQYIHIFILYVILAIEHFTNTKSNRMRNAIEALSK